MFKKIKDVLKPQPLSYKSLEIERYTDGRIKETYMDKHGKIRTIIMDEEREFDENGNKIVKVRDFDVVNTINSILDNVTIPRSFNESKFFGRSFEAIEPTIISPLESDSQEVLDLKKENEELRKMNEQYKQILDSYSDEVEESYFYADNGQAVVQRQPIIKKVITNHQWWAFFKRIN